MERILIINDEEVREMTNISQNISGKLIGTALFEAQDVEFRSIVGDKLYNRVLSEVKEGVVTPGVSSLLESARYFIAYSALADVCLLTAVKIDNAGLQQVTDERMNPISISDSFEIQAYYQKKADYYCKRLQEFLLRNKGDYPELCDNGCHEVKSNLYSSANCGLWLGGPRTPNRKKYNCGR